MSYVNKLIISGVAGALLGGIFSKLIGFDNPMIVAIGIAVVIYAFLSMKQ